MRLVAPLLALLVLAAACSDSEPAETTQPAATATAEAAEPTEAAPTEQATDQPAEAPTEAPTEEPTEPPTATAPTVPTDLAVTLTPIATVDQPLTMATRAGSDALWIGGKGGQVWRYDGGDPELVLDISDQVSGGNEQGLLGLAFSPDGDRLFVSFTDRAGANQVVEYQMEGDAPILDSARTVLTVDQPASNHNGGHIAFGPDGFLYLGLGDGGGAGDQFGNGQDPNTLLGTIVRIDPLGGDPYAVPADNPFVDGGGADEVWAYGLRNPWRFSFDAATGDLWIGDVGQDAIEEVTVLYASDGRGGGANLEWSLLEGSQPFAASSGPDGGVGPIYEYTHSETGGCSVTGGYVYRGSAIPELTGNYVFGDFCTAELWGVTSTESDGLIDSFELGVSVPTGTLASFGEGPDGELYVLGLDGTVYRLDPA